MRTESGRTIVGTALCVDLVGYSKRAVAQQMQVKEAFNRLLAECLRAVPAEDRIILDTGDGAAVTFLGDPEESFAVALNLRDFMNAAGPGLGAAGAPDAEGPVRMGMHLGPVRLVVDVNGRPNIVGDALNTAERIMAFARPGEIVVSRAFHEVLSRVSERNAAHFEPGGTHVDKNGRSHEIHRVRALGAVPPPPARSGDPDAREMTQVKLPPRASRRPAAEPPAPAADDDPAIRIPAVMGARARAATAPPVEPGWIAFLRDVPRLAATAAALVAVIAIEGWWLATRKPSRAAPAIAATHAPVPAAPTPAAPAPARVEPPRPAEPAKRPPEGKRPATKADATKPEATKPEAAKAVTAKAEPAKPEPAKSAPAKPEATKPQPAMPAPTKPAPQKPEPTKTEPVKPAAAKPEPARPEPAKPAASKPEPARAEPKREAPRREEPKGAPARAAEPAATRPAEPAAVAVPAPPPEPKREEPAPAAPPPPVAAPTTDATPVARAPVRFPMAAQTRGIDFGRVRARLTINAAGAVTRVDLISSSARVFEREAISSLEAWKFNPGADNRTYEIEIEFRR